MKKHTNRKELLSCSCIQRVNRREQKGRSMVEILGVLAIIGVLSSGGVLAYNFLMNKHKANGLMEKALDEAVSISEKIRKKNSLKISHKNRSVFSSAEKVGLSHFKISLVPVDTSVCKQLNSMLDRTSLVYDISEDCSYMLFANILGEDSAIMSDLCAGKNCGHGFCSDGACICTDNYYGENCENAPLACQNGGSWNTETKECDCDYGYSGEVCQTEPDPCQDVNCGTHGTCSDGTCVCRDNYYGENCENAPLACQNGGSWNTTTHQCDCPNGYSGNTCGIKDPCLDVNCGAHGTCSGGSCVCTDDYYGDRCQTAPLTCQNGGTWNTTTHQCDCPNGYSGNTCGIKDPCLDVNCGEHGTCSNGACVCRDNYYGENCENAPLTCQNGGTWNTTTHQCDCVTGYTGVLCSEKESGTCTSYLDCNEGEYCQFSPGSNCETDPTSGVCQSVSACNLYDIDIGDGKKYTGSNHSGSCSPDWWTAKDVCASLNMRMVSLSEVGCEDYKNDFCPRTNTIYGALKTNGLRYGFWTTDMDGSCSAWSVNHDFGDYVIPSACFSKNNAFLCISDSDLCSNVDCGDHGTCSNGACVCEDGYGGDECKELFTCSESGYIHSISLDKLEYAESCTRLDGCKVINEAVPADKWLDLCNTPVPDGYYTCSMGYIFDSNGDFVQPCGMCIAGVGATIGSVCDLRSPVAPF